MKHLAHIGGIFIYSEEPQKLADWYKDILGIEYEGAPEYGAFYASFYYDETETGKKRCIAWSILKAKERPKFEGKVFCVNYRINDLEGFVEQLKTKGIEVKGIEEYPEGKFAWINDPEGNYIELWEDVD